MGTCCSAEVSPKLPTSKHDYTVKDDGSEYGPSLEERKKKQQQQGLQRDSSVSTNDNTTTSGLRGRFGNSNNNNKGSSDETIEEEARRVRNENKMRRGSQSSTNLNNGGGSTHSSLSTNTGAASRSNMKLPGIIVGDNGGNVGVGENGITSNDDSHRSAYQQQHHQQQNQNMLNSSNPQNYRGNNTNNLPGNFMGSLNSSLPANQQQHLASINMGNSQNPPGGAGGGNPGHTNNSHNNNNNNTGGMNSAAATFVRQYSGVISDVDVQNQHLSHIPYTNSLPNVLTSINGAGSRQTPPQNALRRDASAVAGGGNLQQQQQQQQQPHGLLSPTNRNNSLGSTSFAVQQMEKRPLTANELKNLPKDSNRTAIWILKHDPENFVQDKHRHALAHQQQMMMQQQQASKRSSPSNMALRPQSFRKSANATNTTGNSSATPNNNNQNFQTNSNNFLPSANNAQKNASSPEKTPSSLVTSNSNAQSGRDQLSPSSPLGGGQKQISSHQVQFISSLNNNNNNNHNNNNNPNSNSNKTSHNKRSDNSDANDGIDLPENHTPDVGNVISAMGKNLQELNNISNNNNNNNGTRPSPGPLTDTARVEANRLAATRLPGDAGNTLNSNKNIGGEGALIDVLGGGGGPKSTNNSNNINNVLPDGGNNSLNTGFQHSHNNVAPPNKHMGTFKPNASAGTSGRADDFAGVNNTDENNNAFGGPTIVSRKEGGLSRGASNAEIHNSNINNNNNNNSNNTNGGVTSSVNAVTGSQELINGVSINTSQKVNNNMQNTNTNTQSSAYTLPTANHMLTPGSVGSVVSQSINLGERVGAGTSGTSGRIPNINNNNNNSSHNQNSTAAHPHGNPNNQSQNHQSYYGGGGGYQPQHQQQQYGSYHRQPSGIGFGHGTIDGENGGSLHQYPPVLLDIVAIEEQNLETVQSNPMLLAFAPDYY